MATLVADTSSLVSLGAAENLDLSLLAILLRNYDVYVPTTVIRELDETASYDDPHGDAAGSVLENRNLLGVRDAEIDASFPLDGGENAAVSLANELEADLFLCDEFNALPLIHASLRDTRLLTTPSLLRVLEKKDLLTRNDALTCLDEIREMRSWEGNSYVERVRQTLQKQG